MTSTPLPNCVMITLYHPPAALHPNARVVWQAKARATFSYRRAAFLAAKDYAYGWEAAEVQATFYVKTNRRRDRDNLLASLKAAFDGLADAGLVADDCGRTHLPVQIAVDKASPRVEIVVRLLNGATA